jgi:N-acetylglutamate synthase-like GNAT family acetyltransferase
MNPPIHQVRRATVDDLPVLRRLWQEALLPVEDHEKRLKEFQAVFDERGRLLGAVGLSIAGRHGHLHSEVFADPTHGELLRDELWERLKAVAQNFGLVRVWTRETAPYWHHIGFQTAAPELLEKLPAAFGSPPPPWLSLILREETAIPLMAEQEMALFVQAQRESADHAMRQIKIMRGIATGVACVLFLVVLVMGFLVLRRHLFPLWRR